MTQFACKLGVVVVGPGALKVQKATDALFLKFIYSSFYIGVCYNNKSL